MTKKEIIKIMKEKAMEKMDKSLHREVILDTEDAMDCSDTWGLI